MSDSQVFSRHRILMASKRPQICGEMARLLARRFDVQTVPDVPAALRALREAAVDLIVTDADLPPLDNVGLPEAFRADRATAGIPIVLMLPASDPASVAKALESGADDVIFEPCSDRELTARIDRRLRLVGAREHAVVDEVNHAALAALVQYSGDAIVGKTLQGTITSWNPAAELLFGYTAAEAVGRNIRMLFPAQRLSEEEAILRQLGRGETVPTYESQRVTKEGRLLDLEITVSPIRDAAGWVIGASKIARDISMRKQLERQLVEASRHKDEFLAVLAHELRNPLAPLRNGLQIARLTADPDSPLQQTIGMMQRQVAHLVHLVDDLLDVNRISRGKIELRRSRLRLAEVLGSSVEATQALLESRRQELTVDVAPDDDRIAVDGDFERLTQVFCNLLSNSAKYSEPGGTIRMTMEREGEEAVVRVIDVGIGIPSHHLSNVFELFSQIRIHQGQADGGLGVGLSLVRSIVTMHGGSVSAFSAGLGTGSTFTVRLPLAVAAAPSPGGAGVPDAFHNERRLRVLVVDDNDDAATSLAQVLELHGHETATAGDGTMAIEMAAALRPDVVMMDLGMPGMDGIEAARRIRAIPECERIVIIALTGWGQPADVERTRAAGMDHHLVKPVPMEALDKLLEECCSARVG